MASSMSELSPAARRRVTMDALYELAEGEMAERLRQETAAQFLRTARRAIEATEAHLPPPAAVANWDSSVTTAREHVEGLTPVQLDRLLEEAPRWAAALLRAEAIGQRRAA